jgi:hypothetical protein
MGNVFPICNGCGYWTGTCCTCVGGCYRISPTYTYKASLKKRIIEKFDDKGNLIERITEEN